MLDSVCFADSQCLQGKALWHPTRKFMIVADADVAKHILLTNASICVPLFVVYVVLISSACR